MNGNQRYTAIEPSAIREYAEAFAKVEGLLPFTIGEPDLNVPQAVKVAVKDAMDRNQTHYAPSQGLLALREVISEYFQRNQALNLKPENIIITNGVTEALNVGMDIFLNHGDKVLVPAPFFGLYETIISLRGGIPVRIDTSQTHYQLTPELLEKNLKKHPETKLVLLNYPNNPIGNTYTEEEIKALAAVIKRHKIYVVSDEIYSSLSYDSPHYSIFNEIPEQTLYLNGPSKSYAMTGARIGFIHLPDDYVGKGIVGHQALVTCVSTPEQYGAIAAYERCDDVVLAYRDEFSRRRELLLRKLPAMGIEFIRPSGAFYLFMKVPELYQDDDHQFALDLANKAKIGVIPGRAFGGDYGKGYVRFSYASSYASIQEGLERLRKFIKNL